MAADDLCKVLVANNMTIDERRVPRLTVADRFAMAPKIEMPDLWGRPLVDVLLDIADLSKEKGTWLSFQITTDSFFNLRFETSVVELGAGTQAIFDELELTIQGNRVETTPGWSVLE